MVKINSKKRFTVKIPQVLFPIKKLYGAARASALHDAIDTTQSSQNFIFQFLSNPACSTPWPWLIVHGSGDTACRWHTKPLLVNGAAYGTVLQELDGPVSFLFPMPLITILVSNNSSSPRLFWCLIIGKSSDCWILYMLFCIDTMGWNLVPRISSYHQGWGSTPPASTKHQNWQHYMV
jgi:hypothetical protein